MNLPETSDTVLVVDDDPAMRRALLELLSAHGYHAVARENAEEALETLQAETVDALVSDLRMPGMKGEALLQEVHRIFPEVPVIAITAFGSVEAAMELTRAGAADYLEKPFRTRALLDSLERVLRDTSAARQQARLRRGRAEHLDEIVGDSDPMRAVFDRIARVAGSPAPVLITGESGTGKELVARAIHRASARDPFLVVNCGAIPEQLLESELFGHARGSFTGATRDKPGLFEAADGGTLFLDEIAELPLPLQPKLLRAIESSDVRRVGEVHTRSARPRIIAATNRELEQAVEEGAFREDLYWRLRVLHLELPPLRDRPADVPLLVRAFLDELADQGEPPSLTREAMAALTAYDWPGNVRQLRNVVQAAVTFASASRVDLEDLPKDIQRSTRSRELVRSAADGALTLAELERDYIFEILRRTGGNKSRAAEILGIPRRTLYRRLEDYASE